jgi:hypothetical protein
LAAVVAALTFAVAADAAVPFQDIGSPAGPLTSVALGNELSCQVQHTGDAALEFFPSSTTPGDCGTFVATGGTVYGPDFANHGPTATGSVTSSSYTPFAAVSQTTKSGAGTSANPFKVVTVVTVGGTGLKITQTDTYVNGQEAYRTDIAIQNTGGGAVSGVLYRAGDCYLQGTDSGFGFTEPNGSVGCSANPNNQPAGRIEEWVPITGGNNFTEDFYSNVWSKIAAMTPFANDCVHCNDVVDNGAGISWSFNIPPGQTATFSHFTTFSPTGRTGAPPPPPPPVTGPAGNPLGLPSNRHCVDTRKFRFKLHHPSGTRIVDVVVKINGKKKLHLQVTDGSINRLTLKKLPQKKFKVQITATQDSGAQLISVRTYKGCKKSKPKTRRGHR